MEQDFEMVLANFPPTQKNKPSNDAAFNLGAVGDANAILTSYAQPATTGGYMGQFSATFNIVPASWDDFQPMPFTFPGFPGFIGANDTRDIFTDIGRTRVRYDYFVVDPDGLAAGVKDSAGADISVVDTLADIPLVGKSNFVVVFGGSPMPSNRTNSIVPVGGKAVGDLFYYQTLPSLATYQAWAAAAVANGWTGTVWDGASDAPGTVSQIVAEDSQIQSFAGNIIARVTKYILVK